MLNIFKKSKKDNDCCNVKIEELKEDKKSCCNVKIEEVKEDKKSCCNVKIEEVVESEDNNTSKLNASSN